MALRTPTSLLSALRCPRSTYNPVRATRQLPQVARFYSTASEDAPPPPLLQTIKGELKAAMRAKDKPRLTVLRAIMSANLNASKTAAPIRTDLQAVAMIRNLQKRARDSIAEAEATGRQDIADKEKEEVQIMEEFVSASGMKSFSDAELAKLVTQAIEATKNEGTAESLLMRDAMRWLMEGPLKDQDVNKKTVSEMVKAALGR